jgi:hypothetical protein
MCLDLTKVIDLGTTYNFTLGDDYFTVSSVY